MYLTSAEYVEITGREEGEAPAGRLKLATQLLDSRVGPKVRDAATGLKLTLVDLPVHQQDAVKTWCAYMVAYLVDHGDKASTTESLTLGRFSVTEHGQQDSIIPEELSFADSILVASGLINRMAGMV